MNQIIGLFAGTLFAYAAVPTAIRTVRRGYHLGTPPDLIATIFTGTVLMGWYLFSQYGLDWVLVVNYLVEGISWGVLLAYWLFRRGASR